MTTHIYLLHGLSEHTLSSLSALNLMNVITINTWNSVNVPHGGLGSNGKTKMIGIPYGVFVNYGVQKCISQGYFFNTTKD